MKERKKERTKERKKERKRDRREKVRDILPCHIVIFSRENKTNWYCFALEDIYRKAQTIFTIELQTHHA